MAAAKKIRDLAVKTGEYTNQQGETKGRYQNVGSLMKDENREFVILNRWFNPAGVPNPDDRDSVIVSCFALRDDNQAPRLSTPQTPPPQDDFDEDIPF